VAMTDRSLDATDDHPHVAVFPPLALGATLVVATIAHVVCPFRIHGAAIRSAGGAIAIASIAVAIWGARTMEAAGTNVRPDRPSTTIVDRGPFARSRNPLYLSMLGLVTGIGVALGSPAFAVWVVPLAIVLRYGVIAREEAYLEKKFGDSYRAYTARVRRWI
jgi:protein-S-isoprenylcysteine O-methyltransferase Ste14